MKNGSSLPSILFKRGIEGDYNSEVVKFILNAGTNFLFVCHFERGEKSQQMKISRFVQNEVTMTTKIKFMPIRVYFGYVP